MASALSNEPTETSFLALSRLDCPCASSSEQASTTTTPTSFICALSLGRIIGSRISGQLARHALECQRTSHRVQTPFFVYRVDLHLVPFQKIISCVNSRPSVWYIRAAT